MKEGPQDVKLRIVEDLGRSAARDGVHVWTEPGCRGQGAGSEELERSESLTLRGGVVRE